jgi:hypothetical protein
MFNNVHLTETRGEGGWCEIGVRRADQLIAVVTHPCAGAKWFVHFSGWRRKEAYKSKEKAIAAATSFALTAEVA